MLTSVSSVCCVGDCGEGTDWVSEDKKLKWDRRRAKCSRTWNEATSCRPQGKLEKGKAASQKARREENRNKMSTTSIFPYRPPKFESILIERCLFVVPLLIFNYGQPNPSKKEAFTTFLFPFLVWCLVSFV